MSDFLASFAEPVAIGVQACRRGDVAPGDRVLVLGAGPIGLAIVEVARAYGAEVFITDVKAERLRQRAPAARRRSRLMAWRRDSAADRRRRLAGRDRSDRRVLRDGADRRSRRRGRPHRHRRPREEGDADRPPRPRPHSQGDHAARLARLGRLLPGVAPPARRRARSATQRSPQPSRSRKRPASSPVSGRTPTPITRLCSSRRRHETLHRQRKRRRVARSGAQRRFGRSHGGGRRRGPCWTSYGAAKRRLQGARSSPNRIRRGDC